MKIWRIEIGFWEYPDLAEKKFIWFEYLNGGCGCKFLTILNLLFAYQSKNCK
jgi:hypothetical protein